MKQRTSKIYAAARVRRPRIADQRAAVKGGSEAVVSDLYHEAAACTHRPSASAARRKPLIRPTPIP